MRECQESAEVAVNHQPKTCKASAEAQLSGINRGNTSDSEPPIGIEPMTYALRERPNGAGASAVRPKSLYFQGFRVSVSRVVLRIWGRDGDEFDHEGMAVQRPSPFQCCQRALHPARSRRRVLSRRATAAKTASNCWSNRLPNLRPPAPPLPARHPPRSGAGSRLHPSAVHPSICKQAKTEPRG